MSNKSIKKQNINEDIASSTEKLNVTQDGYIFFGNLHESRDTQDGVPKQSYFGTSLTGGNKIRNLYNFNTHPSIHYEPTGDDKQQIIRKYSNYIATNAILSTYPWLYPIPEINNWSQTTESLLENPEFNIYKCLGKGLGKIKFYKSGSSFIGQETAAGNTINSENYITYGNPPSNIDSGNIYPFNGYIYAGSLVQLITEGEETKVIPYQTGRGIPLYSKNYAPEESSLLTFAPFGELQWDSGNTISPSIATGVSPGRSNASVGIVLDSYAVNKERLFKPQEQNENSTNDLQYYNHPAPQTSPPVSVVIEENIPTTKGFLSPGPNLSGTFYAPWPRDYAYKPDEPIPVLTQGIVTAKIGASHNIALMTYGIRQQISPTDESWMPVTCIPLFQGERLEAGSIVYASLKGNIMTPGAFQPNETLNGVPIGVVGQTPWDPYVDSTYGNVGWTGTPGISFGFIPDQENAILEVYPDQNSNQKVIKGLNQANQGTIIVQAVTTHSPTPSIGNSYLQTNPKTESEETIEQIKRDRFNLPGISGRCTLPQTIPENAQPIGILMETVVGTGKWSYTGLPIETTDTISEIVQGGMVYGNPSVLGNVPLRTNTGLGTGGESTWTTFNPDEPYLGTILDPISFPVVGIGYVDGDIVTLQDNSLNWDTTQFQYHGNNTSLIVSGGGTSLILQSGGSGYAVSSYSAFNLSLNNAYFDFDEAGGDLFFVGTLVGSDYFQDFSRYPENTVIRVLNTGGNFSTLAYFYVPEYLEYTNVNLNVFKPSAVYTTIGNTFMETEQSNYNTLNGRPEINVLTVGSNGEIETFEYIDYGCGNKNGDRLLIINGTLNNNAVINFEMPSGQQEIIASGPHYSSSSNPWDTVDLLGNPTIATINVINDPNDNYNTFPIIFEVDTPIGANEIVRLNDTSFNYATPRYHGYNTTVLATPTGNEPHRGGTNYTTENNVSTYNLTANSLRVYFTISNEVLTNQVAGVVPYNNANFPVIEERYTFDSTNGTQVKILHTIPDEFQEIIQLIDFDTSTGLTSTQIKSGGQYPLPDNNYIFQTQRTDQVNPTVDITVDSNGYVRQAKLRSAGIGNENGDIILITQEGSDQNALFIFNNNMPLIDLPPYANREGYRVETDDAAWQRYSDVMSTAVNLFNKDVMIELRETNDYTMENIYPSAFISSFNAPPTNDIYREMYN